MKKEENKFDENLILSGIIKFGRDGFADCCDIIKAETFDGYLNQLIFSSIEKVFSDGNPITITSVFQKTGLGDDRYNDVKSILSNDCYDIKDIRPAAIKVRKRQFKNDAIGIYRKCIDDIYKIDENQPASKIISAGELALFDLIAKGNYNEDSGPTKIQNVVRKYVQEWEEAPAQNVGIPLPWRRFNESIGGGLRSGVHLVGARLKVGKTSIGLMTAIHAAVSYGVPVLILDTEMLIKDVLPRMVANISDVEISTIERGLFVKDEFKKKCIYQAVSALESVNICHRNVGGYEFDDIISTIRRWIYTDVGLQPNGEANPMLVIFDYFKVMNAKELATINESQALGFQISKMVDFSKKFNFPCLSFVQLNRDGISREDSAAVGNSDKLAQLANSLTIFKKKTLDEVNADGPENGNRKLITTDSRYGGESDYASEYISLQMKKESCILQELNFEPKRGVKLQGNAAGGSTKDREHTE